MSVSAKPIHINDGIASSKRLIFVHIPKTAGTSISSAMRRSFPDHTILRAGKAEETRRLREMDQSEIQSYRIISAHQPYPVLKKLCGEGAYFTVLRDPVQRAFSIHAHIVRYDWDPHHEIMKERDISYFLDWLCDDPMRHLLNHQSYFLSMNLDSQAAFATLKNLRAFDVENVDEEIGPYLFECGGRRLDLHRLNVSSQTYEITPMVKRKIEHVFEADIALWTAFRTSLGATPSSGPK